MKKFYLVAVIIIALLVFCGCSKSSASSDTAENDVVKTQPAESSVAVKEPVKEKPAPVVAEKTEPESKPAKPTISLSAPVAEEPAKKEEAPVVKEPVTKTTFYNTKTPVIEQPVKNSRASTVHLSDGSNEVGIYASPYGTNFTSEYGTGAKLSYSHISSNGFFAGGDLDYYFFKDEPSKKHEFNFTARGGFTFNVGKNKNWYVRPQLGAGVNLTNMDRKPAFTAAI